MKEEEVIDGLTKAIKLITEISYLVNTKLDAENRTEILMNYKAVLTDLTHVVSGAVELLELMSTQNNEA